MKRSVAPAETNNESKPGEIAAEPLLEFLHEGDFGARPPRLTPEQAFRFCEEMLPYFHYSELDRQTRADRPGEEFILL
jgi:hypothetical protein